MRHPSATPSWLPRIDIARPRVLVAGCGTGRHALLAARRYAECRVLAIELGGAALAYAARQAARFGVGNVEFAQADILEVGSVGERFDVIECTGVLHHLASPEAGWAALRPRLVPGGLMKIGLYSRLGRARFDPNHPGRVAPRRAER